MNPCPAARWGGAGGVGTEQLRDSQKNNIKNPVCKLKITTGIKDGSAERVQVLAPVCRAFGGAAWDTRCPRPTAQARGVVTGGVREGSGRRGGLRGRPRSIAPAARRVVGGGEGGGLKGEGAMLRILLKQKVEQRVCTGSAPSLKDCNFLLWCLAGFATDINGNINSAWKVLNKTV